MLNRFIPPHHWQIIAASVRPFIGEIDLAMLGGSRASGVTTRNSDSDLLLIGEHINQPVSLTKCIDDQKYDLILRDPYALAYDFAHDPLIGRGTLLHISTFGIPLVDRHGKAQILQEKAAHLYQTGPAAVERSSLDDQLDSLHRRIDGSCATPPTTSLIEAFMLAHDLGITAQRAARQWVGKGKIMGRFLLQHLPAIKNEIELGFPEMCTGNPSRFKNLVTHQIPTLYRNNHEQVVPFRARGTLTKNPVDMADAFTTVRTCPDMIPEYLYSTTPLKRDAAHLWLRWKFDNAASAITTDRIGRPSNEYFYALAKYVDQAITLNSYSNGRQPISNRIAACPDHHPALRRYITHALQGRPEHLLNWGQKIYAQTLDDTENNTFPPRPAPAHHRLIKPFI